MSVIPKIGAISVPEAQALLHGLVQLDVYQLQHGVAPISQALRSGRLVYIRRDPDEHWLNIREIWERGGGDCEDLAAAIAAELIAVFGRRARVVLKRMGPRLVHAITEDIQSGLLLDPSITGGMET